jgi:hypothetical protein
MKIDLCFFVYPMADPAIQWSLGKTQDIELPASRSDGTGARTGAQSRWALGPPPSDSVAVHVNDVDGMGAEVKANQMMCGWQDKRL